MGFALVDEVGITYGPAEAPGRAVRLPSPPLRYPVYAARAADGTTVIVDELAIEKSLHLRAWYRTLRLDPDGVLLADSAEWGDDDASCCLPTGSAFRRSISPRCQSGCP